MTRSTGSPHVVSWRHRQGGSVRSAAGPSRSDQSRSTPGDPPRSGADVGWVGWRAGTTPLLLCDIGAILASGLLTHADVVLPLVVCPVTLLVYAHLQLYRLRLTVSVLDDLPRLVVGFAAAVATASVLREEVPQVGRGDHLLGTCVVGAALVLTRAVAYLLVRWLRSRLTGSATLILGTGQIGQRLGQAMLDHPEHGLRLVGYLGEKRRRQSVPPAPLLGGTDELGRLIEDLGIRCVVVTFGSVSVAALVDVLRTCDRLHCEILLVPRLFELHTTTRDTEYVQGLPLVRMRRAPFRRPSWRVKRAVDVVAAIMALVLLAPLLVACGLAVRLEGGPGVLFRQERVGLDGRRFQMLKFRSLRPASETESQVRWTVAGDPRIGPVGRLLRNTSLDELPQLVNVLRGDMSLVGPRPERPYFVEQLSLRHPRYGARHRVPAGLTGWAAVNGLRGDTSISDRVRFDNAYIENWSLWLDAKIILRTFGAVLGRTGG